MTLTPTTFKTLQTLKLKNTKDTLEEGLKILLRLLDNVISDPGQAKYRRIRTENKIIKEKLLCLDGMEALLGEIGFEYQGEVYSLPTNVLIARLKECRMEALLGEIGFEYQGEVYSLPTNVLIARLKECRMEIDRVLIGKEEEEGLKETGTKKKKVKREEICYKAGKSFVERTTFSKVITSANRFLLQLEDLSDQVMQYEDPVLQETGRSVIPLEKLKLKTLENLRRVQKQIKTGKSKEIEPSYDDLFIWELAEWFKSDFFTWVNSPTCLLCSKKETQAVGQINENGIRVEQYRCCNRLINFYRYNDVLKLLQTRKGRCGEWANCFTFLCRCLGYRARYVFSTEDHVWTEIYSTLQNRWIHVDPSDNVIDAPLMYEHGWKKTIRYIIAFSSDDVQDVTWRYTNQHQQVLRKRDKCTEKELLDTILALRYKRQEGFSQYWVKNYKKRTLRELADFMVEREPTEDEKRGRSSGSLAWRQARMEVDTNSFYIFEPLDSEIQSKQFNLRYSCALDTYERYLRTPSGEITKTLLSTQGWNTLVYHADKIFKKYESDWKMNYLARTEGSESSSIMWRFDFSGKGLKIDDLQYKLESKTFENGAIDIFLLDKNGLRVNDLKELKGETKFSIKAVLTGGRGDCAWQHTQLFRQEKGSKDFPFVINVKFS